MTWAHLVHTYTAHLLGQVLYILIIPMTIWKSRPVSPSPFYWLCLRDNDSPIVPWEGFSADSKSQHSCQQNFSLNWLAPGFLSESKAWQLTPLEQVWKWRLHQHLSPATAASCSYAVSDRGSPRAEISLGFWLGFEIKSLPEDNAIISRCFLNYHQVTWWGMSEDTCQQGKKGPPGGISLEICLSNMQYLFTVLQGKPGV